MIFEFGGFRLDATKRELTGPDGPIDVPSRAFDVLLFLVSHPGELLDKTTLMKAVWPATVVEEGNLSRCIFELRRALGDTASEPRFISTVPGRGYQFIQPVREVSPATTAGNIQTGQSRWLLPAGAVLAIAVVLLATWGSWPASERSVATDYPPDLVPASIAVVPFADMTSTRDMEYFSEGLAEELRNSLSKVRALRVIGRQSSTAFAGKGVDTRAVSERLHVAAILEGSVRREGDRIDIKVHLIRARDGVILWSEMYLRQFDDVLDIQGSIAREVAATLAPAVLDSQGSGMPGSFDTMVTRNAEAYRAYLRGVYLMTRSYDADPQPARVEFLRALERDPEFAMAYAMLSRTYEKSAEIGVGDVTRQKSLSIEALDKAIKLDPAIADLWWVKLRAFEQGDLPFEKQATQLEQAVAANPSDIEPMIWLGHTYLALGRRNEALQMFERAYAADPLSPMVVWNYARYGYVVSGDRRRMLDLTDEMERLAPRDAGSSWIRSNLAFREGRALDWDRHVARVIEIDPADYQNHAWLALDYGTAGAYDAAFYHARTCSKLAPDNVLCTYSLARTEMVSGDLAGARKTVLEAATHDPDNPLILLSQGELLYYTGDCAGSLRSIARARPGYNQKEAALNLFHYNDDVGMYAWCLRQQGQTDRLAAMNRVFNVQYPPTSAAKSVEGIYARMAAANGDRTTLVARLTDFANSRSEDLVFTRHEPMIQPWSNDREVIALLDKIDARRSEFRGLLPKASTRIPVPGETDRAGR